MIDPAVIDRLLVLAQIVLIFGGVAVVIRAFDLVWAAAGRRQARRRLQRGQRLVARRHAWDAIDELTRHDTGRLW